MIRCPIAAVAFVVTAGFAWVVTADVAAAKESRIVAANRDDLIARFQSDSWSVRHAASSELRKLNVEEVALLGELAAHRDPQVRAAALDVLSRWIRGADEVRRVAARDLLVAIARDSHAGSKQAAARLETLLSEIERSALGELAASYRPLLELT